MYTGKHAKAPSGERNSSKNTLTSSPPPKSKCLQSNVRQSSLGKGAGNLALKNIAGSSVTLPDGERFRNIYQNYRRLDSDLAISFPGIHSMDILAHVGNVGCIRSVITALFIIAMD